MDQPKLGHEGNMKTYICEWGQKSSEVQLDPNLVYGYNMGTFSHKPEFKGHIIIKVIWGQIVR